MKRGVIAGMILLAMLSCQSKKDVKSVEATKESKKKGIIEEYKQIKTKLEPQGYIITTDSVDKIFIDHSVTINYHNKKNKL